MKNRESSLLLSHYRIGDLEIHRDKHQVLRSRESLAIGGLSFQLLDTLAQHWPETVSHEQLEQAVWGNVHVSRDTVRQRIRLLRQALGDTDFISADKGRGYRLTVPVMPISNFRHSWALKLAASLVLGVLMTLITVALVPGDFYHEIRHGIRHGVLVDHP